MADPQKPSKTPRRGPRLPALERLSPVPDMGSIAAEIAARTKAGDVVLELHGRGGWVTRGAIDALRRSFTIETTALTRLVAEIVLRPPDLRHLDAAVSGIAVDARGIGGRAARSHRGQLRLALPRLWQHRHRQRVHLEGGCHRSLATQLQLPTVQGQPCREATHRGRPR